MQAAMAEFGAMYRRSTRGTVLAIAAAQALLAVAGMQFSSEREVAFGAAASMTVRLDTCR